MYIHIYVVDATLLPTANQVRKLGKHIILVYQFLMKGFPIMKSLWARHPHKSPHNHTLHVPAKMNDSVIDHIYKLISSLPKTSFHHLISIFPPNKKPGKTCQSAEIFNNQGTSGCANSLDCDGTSLPLQIGVHLCGRRGGGWRECLETHMGNPHPCRCQFP